MSIDRSELQDSARRAFGENGLAPNPAESWNLIAEMGWLMMAVPEDLGGLGLGREAEGVIHSELGRAIVPGPIMAQMMVIEALSAANNLPERDDLLGRAMGGEVMTASLDNPAAFTTKHLSCVPDADKSSHVLICDKDKIALLPLDGAHSIAARDSWDKSRRLFDVTITEGAKEYVLATGADAAALHERLQSQLLFALAGDSLGGANSILEITIDYLKMRRQFDRPLALFQALKHRVADMKAMLVAAEALFWARTTDPASSPIQMGALKAHACGIYRAIAEESIQLHGGIGLTMEHDCHLFLKRAMLNCALGGDADMHDEIAGRAQMLAFA